MCRIGSLIIIGLIVFFGQEVRPVRGDVVSEENAMIAEINKNVSQVTAYRKTKNINGLEQFAAVVERRWKKRNKEFYYTMMHNICSELVSYDYGTDKRFEVAEKYAFAMLQNADEMPIELEVDFIKCTIHEKRPVNTTDAERSIWSKRRSYKAKSWLHAWQRIENGYVGNFNFDDLPMINLAPPTDSGMPSGVSPKAIKNPKLRAEYEAAIKQNEQKTRRYNEQYQIHKMRQRYFALAEKYLISIYSRPPYNVDELKQLLNTYVSDKERRERIVKVVEQRMDSSPQVVPEVPK